MMNRLIFVILLCLPISAGESASHFFVCASPSLAVNFWEGLLNLQQSGVTVTPKIFEEVCAGMHAGQYRQCIRIDADDFLPVASGWGGTLAMSDGKTKIWFHNPDGLGWVHPDYYITYANMVKRSK